MKLKQKITEIYIGSRKTYGSPRIYQKLLREGYTSGKVNAGAWYTGYSQKKIQSNH